jgi:hypothetical protein
MTEASPLFDDAPLRLMRPAALADKLWQIARGCGTTEYPQPLPDDAEWAGIIRTILPPTGGLAPFHWRDRMLAILAGGSVPAAWVYLWLAFTRFFQCPSLDAGTTADLAS